MNNDNMVTACKEYITFFKNGKVSNVNPDCVIENPFFISDAKYGKDLNIEINENISDEYKDTFSKLHFSTRILYSFIGDNKEYQINDFTFFTLREAQKRMNNYKYFYDIALKYAGMGHVLVLSFHPNTNKFFVRHDGGANGYEREDHYNFYLNYNPEIDTSRKSVFFDYEINKLITFKEFMNLPVSLM
jgi:hypothetical protein